MSEHEKWTSSQINQGIQANTVTGEVIAVGHKAVAIKNADGAGNQQQLLQAIEQLSRSLERLDLQAHAKAAVNEDIAELRSAASSKDQPTERAAHVLKGLTGKLKMVGVVLSQVVGLAEPVKKIAELLHVPLHMLGF